MPIIGAQGQISYSLGGTAHLVSFPFVVNPPFTPTTLNEALGGSIGGTPPSSSVLGAIIGEAESSVFMSDIGQFVGSLTEIDPKKSYWIKPPSGSTNFNLTASISGELINHTETVNRPAGSYMTAYPFPENKLFGQAVRTGSGDEFALHNNGYLKIIGEGTSMLYSMTDPLDAGTAAWRGNITEFTSGSGYWFIKTHPQDIPIGIAYDGFAIPMFRQDSNFLDFPTAEDFGQLPWHECTDAGYSNPAAFAGNQATQGTYGYHCTHNYPSPPSSGTGYNIGDGQISLEPPINLGATVPAHSFGHRQTSDIHGMMWNNSIGKGSGSLFDSASNDMSGSTDGTNDFIVGWFATSSQAVKFPMCCGASAWHDNQFAFVTQEGNLGGRFINFSVFKEDSQAQDLGYPSNGDPIVPRIYDPRRNIVVTGSVHNVTYDGSGNPSIGPKTILSASTSAAGILFYTSGSENLFSSIFQRPKVIVMDS